MKRRQFLGAGALALTGCEQPAEIAGGFTGVHDERGHTLREARSWPAPAVTHRTRVVIAGGGVAGLAAARALRLRGIDDFHLLELEDTAGGNSRGGLLNGVACPLGAHYLPVPEDDAREVQDLLEELGVRHRVAGRWTYDERHLCHSPQERLFFKDAWHEGLLPVHEVGEATLAQYRRFANEVERLRRTAKFAIPLSSAPLSPVHRDLDRTTFAAWLEQKGLTDAHLRWYLSYCCRDDYGAGPEVVSAWAGIHYFASRHGFHAPGGEPGERDAVLTWPQGNAWLTEKLAAPLEERLKPRRVVTRIAAGRHGVEVDAWNTATQAIERWQAQQCVVALPLFVAARVMEIPPPALLAAARLLRYAPWLVSNLHIRAPLHDRPGAAPSWDNLIYGAPGLGYVDAMHQSLGAVPGATVLTHYHAPLSAAANPAAIRKLLLEQPWSHWRDAVLAELSVPHPDLRAKVTRIDITRYGHAMSIPLPGLCGHAALAALQKPQPQAWQRLYFAHSDLSGYSIFEEAFTHGHRAGMAVA
ncbi:MAG TPA: FAD-dependent oxidoreductase [Burkholderiaceae bacterium]|nr:FAD-dependent oxidoreductase [Burkholderiaceae bacterium]